VQALTQIKTNPKNIQASSRRSNRTAVTLSDIHEFQIETLLFNFIVGFAGFANSYTAALLSAKT
jgi:hypothetical protein